MPSKKKDLKCPKCAEAMEEGIVLDRGEWNVSLTPLWVKGRTEFSWKTGLKVVTGHKAVATWRCTGCGYLESYAG
jgi:predicted nucleic-acid-binding Zn-ribbon protein